MWAVDNRIQLACVKVCVHACVVIYVYVFACLCVYVLHVCVRVCVCVCVCVCVWRRQLDYICTFNLEMKISLLDSLSHFLPIYVCM